MEAALVQVQSTISRGEVTEDLLLRELDLQADLTVILDRKHEFLRQRRRVNWLNDGDHNTKFFHQALRLKRARSSIGVLSIDGEICNDKARIALHIVDFYKALFSSPSIDFQGLHEIRNYYVIVIKLWKLRRIF